MTLSVLEINQLRFAWTSGKAADSKSAVNSELAASPYLLDIPHLSLARGEKLFLRGPSGSGKTTLLSLIGGILQGYQGELSLFGQSLADLSPSAKDKFRADHIGFVFQQFNLMPWLTMRDNVLLSCQFSARRKKAAIVEHGSISQAASVLLTGLGLSENLHDRPVQQLSIGQQQRVAVARALIGNPGLLIADEPTSALDHSSRNAFMDLLFEQCQRSDCALMFVSHDPSLEKGFDRCISLGDINKSFQPQREVI